MFALVTGGHGFIGSHLCEALLAAGHRVRILARPESNLSNLGNLNVEVIRGDLCEPKTLPLAVEGCDWVFHLAGALKGLRRSDHFRVNAEGTKNLVTACETHNPSLSRFLFVSSLAAAGPSNDGPRPLKESDPSRPISWYGESKLAAEEIVRSAKNLSWTIVRPPTVFGPNDRELYPYFQAVRKGWMPAFGFHDRFYSVIFAPDLAQGLIHCAQAPAARGETYYLSNPDAVTWTMLGEAIVEALGIRARTIRIPDMMVRSAGVLSDLIAHLRGKPHMFSSQKVLEMRESAWVCSPEKAKRDLHWNTTTSFQDGIRNTVRGYQGHGWL